MNHDILDSLDKPKISGNCGFPLTNPHSGESVYSMPLDRKFGEYRNWLDVLV
jgi:hypothetical protein